MKITPAYLTELFEFPHCLDITYRQNREGMKDNFYQLYEMAGLDMPKVFYFKSPLALQKAIHLMHMPSHRLGDFLYYEVYRSFFEVLANETLSRKPVQQRIWRWVNQEVSSQVSQYGMGGKAILERIQWLNPFATALEACLTADLQHRLKGKGLHFYTWANHPHFKDRVWLEAQKHLLDFTGRDASTKLLLLDDMIKKGLMYCHLTEDFVLWCPLPQGVHLDREGQLSNETGPALYWEDDYALYYWHGVKVSRRLIEHPQTITKLDVIEEKNAEVRRCIQEKLGTERFAGLFQLQLIDEDIDLQGHPQYLYRTVHMDDVARSPIQFARVYCPTSGRAYFLCVPPEIRNVWEAVAWTFGKTAMEYRPLKET